MPVPAPPPSRPALDPGRAAVPGWRVEVLAATPSTNAELTRRALAGEPPGLALTAEHQTAGRGRLDRVWLTPPRSALTVSLLVRPDGVPPGRWPWLPLVTGLAVLDAVAATTGLRPSLKWPNDVLLDRRADGARGGKLAGILIERVEAPGGPLAVVGVGLNVSTTARELPVPTATSLALAGAGDVDRSVLLAALLTAFSARYDAWRAAAGVGPLAAYVAACSTVGRQVRVQLPGGQVLEGDAVGVDDDGRLQVADAAGVHALGAGDVLHVRPAGVRDERIRG